MDAPSLKFLQWRVKGGNGEGEKTTRGVKGFTWLSQFHFGCVVLRAAAVVGRLTLGVKQEAVKIFQTKGGHREGDKRKG